VKMVRGAAPVVQELDVMEERASEAIRHLEYYQRTMVWKYIDALKEKIKNLEERK
jgi:hypothetical protein